jgi:hypothetical protein
MVKELKAHGKVQSRLIEATAALEQQEDQALCFQNSVFCQMGLPYRDPGDTVRCWQPSTARSSKISWPRR